MRISYEYENYEVESSCLNRCLLDFTAGILRSVMLKILKGLRFDTKYSIKQYFLDMSSLKHDIYRAMESS